MAVPNLTVVEKVEGDREAKAILANGGTVTVEAMGALGFDEWEEVPTILFSYSEEGADWVRHLDQSEAETMIKDARWIQRQVERIAAEYNKKGPVLL